MGRCHLCGANAELFRASDGQSMCELCLDEYEDLTDADRDMIGDESSYFDGDIGNK